MRSGDCEAHLLVEEIACGVVLESAFVTLEDLSRDELVHYSGDVPGLVPVPVSAATPSICPTRAKGPRSTTALRGSGALKGWMDEAAPAEMRVEQVGFPGAGHWSLLRSGGGAGESRRRRIPRAEA